MPSDASLEVMRLDIAELLQERFSPAVCSEVYAVMQRANFADLRSIFLRVVAMAARIDELVSPTQVGSSVLPTGQYLDEELRRNGLEYIDGPEPCIDDECRAQDRKATLIEQLRAAEEALGCNHLDISTLRRKADLWIIRARLEHLQHWLERRRSTTCSTASALVVHSMEDA